MRPSGDIGNGTPPCASRRHVRGLVTCLCASWLLFAGNAISEELGRAHELQEAFIKVGERVGPTVVTILVKRKGVGREAPLGQSGENRGGPEVGSGVIVDAQGHILTNEHVIAGADSIQVVQSNGVRRRVSVVGADPLADLAVLRTDHKGLPSIEIGDSDKLRTGQWALALGNPFGIARDARPTLTVGVISGLRRAVPRKAHKYYGDLIQTDAAINPGNSGGPLVDLDGRLIGINVLIFSTTGGYQGIGFAIPANRAMRIADSLIKYGKIEYGWLGIRVGDVAETEASVPGAGGARVTEVLPHSPAAEAGLREHDIVHGFDGRPVRTSYDLIRLVRITPPGRKVAVRLTRDGKPREMTVTLKSHAGH